MIGAMIVRLSAARHRPHAGSCEHRVVDLDARVRALQVVASKIVTLQTNALDDFVDDARIAIANVASIDHET